MTDIATSFASVKADKVISACNMYLAERNERIQAEKDVMIRKEMNRWLFPAKTVDEAEIRLRTGDIMNAEHVADAACWTPQICALTPPVRGRARMAMVPLNPTAL